MTHPTLPRTFAVVGLLTALVRAGLVHMLDDDQAAGVQPIIPTRARGPRARPTVRAA